MRPSWYLEIFGSDDTDQNAQDALSKTVPQLWVDDPLAPFEPATGRADARAQQIVDAAFVEMISGATQLNPAEPSIRNFAKLQKRAKHQPNIRAIVGAAKARLGGRGDVELWNRVEASALAHLLSCLDDVTNSA